MILTLTEKLVDKDTIIKQKEEQFADITKDKERQIKQLIEDKDSISKDKDATIKQLIEDKDATIKQLTESFGSIIKQHGEQLAHRDNVIKEKEEQIAHKDNVINEKDGQIADYVKQVFQMQEDLNNLQLQQSGTNTNSLLNSNGKRARYDPTPPTNSLQKADSPLILLSPNSYEYMRAEFSNDSFVETFENNQSNSKSIS